MIDFKAVFTQLKPHLLALLACLAVSSAYFYPQLKGEKINAHDQVSSIGAAKESLDYAEDGDVINWTGSLFAGMPTFQINYLQRPSIIKRLDYYRGFLGDYISLLFGLCFGMYLCLTFLGVKSLPALIGAIGYGLSTWFLLSIEAGHNSKVVAIIYLAPFIGACLTYLNRGGIMYAIIAGIFTSLMFGANHLQIAFYGALAISVFTLVHLAIAAKNGELSSLVQRVGFLVAFGVLGVANTTDIIAINYDYASETMRGGQTELNKPALAIKSKSTGLEYGYATAWSNSPMETVTLLIPNYAGGGSGVALDEDSETYASFISRGVPAQQAKQVIKQLPMYWGQQSSLSGPVYMGAVIMFLFFAAMISLKARWKWGVLGAIILAILLSWGSTFPLIFDLFFYNFPQFNKFRTPSMILVLPIVLCTVMAFYYLHTILFKKDKLHDNHQKQLMYAFYGVGGFCLLVALLPELFGDFTKAADDRLVQVGYPLDAIVQDRISMARSDAFRSLILVALSFGVVYAYLKDKLKKTSYVLLAIGLLAIGDLWLVGKRYVNADDFQKARNHEQFIQPTQADQQILADNNGQFRVFNTTVSSFNDNSTSYFHNSVGGYSAAKLFRYQDLIEYHLGKGNMQVFNMLNTRYFIQSTEQQGAVARMNPTALGNAWFVDVIKTAENADEEMALMNNFNAAKEAIVDKRFDNMLSSKFFKTDGATIVLSDFHPDRMVYTSNNSQDGFAVFSEIWYKGNQDWKAYIDGQEVDHVRTNYLLRGLEIPAGKHEIVFEFAPVVLEAGLWVSRISSWLLLFLLLFFGYRILPKTY